MALHLREKHPFIPRLVGLFLAIAALLVQSFATLPMSVVNASEPSSSPTSLTIDGAVPAATISSPAEGQSLSTEDQNGKLMVGGSFTYTNDRSTLLIELVRVENVIAEHIIDGSELTDNTFTTEFDVSDQPNGEYSIFYAVVDMAGNESERFERKFIINNQGSLIVITPIYGETEPEPATEAPVITIPVDPSNISDGGVAISIPRSNAFSLAQPAVFAPILADPFIEEINNAVATDTEIPVVEPGAVLGTSNNAPKEIAAVAGVSDKANWTLGSLTWYGWVAAVIGLTGLWLLIAAASRRLRGAES